MKQLQWLCGLAISPSLFIFSECVGGIYKHHKEVQDWIKGKSLLDHFFVIIQCKWMLIEVYRG